MPQTILDIKTAMASYLDLTGVTSFTVNSQDLALQALNNVRRAAELQHDFEFSRRLVTVAVDGTTGGSLDSALLYSDGVTPVTIKTVIEAGLFDSEGNLRPVEWTTVAESLERQRQENRGEQPRLVTDDWYLSQPGGFERFTFTGSRAFRWPKDPDHDFTLGLEVYSMQADWTGTVTVTGATGDYTDVNGTWVSGTVGTETVFFKYDSGSYCYVMWQSAGVWYITAAEFIFDTGASSNYSLASGGPGGTYTAAGSFTGSPVVTYTTASSDVWTTYGAQYLQWAAIVELNHLFKHFVYRQEGNLPPPEKLRDEALEKFVMWDAYRFEQNRRHSR